MKMNELIDQHLASPGSDAKYLVQALAKTGPLVHKGQYYSGTIEPAGHKLQVGTKSVTGVRDANVVDVPQGSYPGVDPEQDAFRGRAVALKANAVRILDSIDQALDTTAGNGGLSNVLAALRATKVNVEGENIDGIHALTLAINTVQQAAAELEEMTVRHDKPGSSGK